MNCEVCPVGQRQARRIRCTLAIGDGLILVDHVPAEVCDRCGEVTLSPETVERLQQTIWKQRPPSKVIETPVYEFA